MPLPYINASNFYRAGGITLYRQTISPEVNAILFSVDRRNFAISLIPTFATNSTFTLFTYDIA